MPLFGKKKDKKAEKKPAKSNGKRLKPKKDAKPAKKGVKQAAPRKAAEKITPKKASAKKSSGVVEKKTSKKGVKVLVPAKESTGKRVYHVSKRSDGKWDVKFAGGEKAIKLFNTQAEAVEYTKKMSSNQDGVMLVHNSKGKNKGRIQ